MNRILTFFQSGSVPELDMHESKNFLPAQFVHSDIARRVFGNSMQASYFERFYWSILNFWTLQTVEHAVRVPLPSCSTVCSVQKFKIGQ